MKRIIDISRKISDDMLIWPGDPQVKIKAEKRIDEGSSCNVSSINMGLHSGTHADAPFHFINCGKTMEEVCLNKFFGKAKVFEIKDSVSIRKEHLTELDIKENDIVLFKTSNSNICEEQEFEKGYVYIDKSAAEYLVSKKISAVAVDYLSVDGKGVPNHPTHNILLKENIGIIEGVILKEVEEGEYILSALPLKIQGVDASPVRAVLVEI